MCLVYDIKHLQGKRVRRFLILPDRRGLETSRYHAKLTNDILPAQEFLHQAALVAAHVKSTPARLVGHGWSAWESGLVQT
jgi:hypothetical protein